MLSATPTGVGWCFAAISSRVVDSNYHLAVGVVFIGRGTGPWIEGCNIVYLNDSIAGKQRSGDILRDYSYMVKSASERHRDLPLKTFKAERYGGDGLIGQPPL